MSVRACSVEGCDRKHLARGWCSLHYDRWRRRGDPLVAFLSNGHQHALPLAERLWSRVDRSAGPDACWPWTGSRNELGYGSLLAEGPPRRKIMAHRAAWELAHGPIPEGLQVLHRCDNPPCCNPADLFLGTRDDNMADMAAKGRAARAGAKLTPAEVEAVRARHAGGGVLQRELADEFGVSPSAISLLLSGRTWRRP